MSISRADYDDILAAKRRGELSILIDKASFRQFFMHADPIQVEQRIGESILWPRRIVVTLFYAELPCVIGACVALASTFKWWSLAMIPIYVIVWFAVSCRSSMGPVRIGIPGLLLIAGIVAGAVLHETGSWARILMVAGPLGLVLKPAMYYLVTRFTFDLIGRNFEWFRLFYYAPGHLGFPFIWTYPDDERFAGGIDERIAYEMGTHSSAS